MMRWKLVLTMLATLVVAACLLSCQPVGFANEDCGNGIDDDSDGFIDCQDAYCDGVQPDASRGGIFCEYGRERNCSDSFDNDGDGLENCEDDDCACTDGEFPICWDEIDNDRDGAIDCDDTDCWFDLECGPHCECSGFACRNGRDDDWDGQRDCEDPECVEIGLACVEDCASGVDDDGDGLVDCADPECASRTEQRCGDGADDASDCDRLADCADPDCAAFGIERFCADGADDASDCDALADCADPDCAAACAIEICNNGHDEPDPGFLWDCVDPACDGQDGGAAPGMQRCELGTERTCDDGFDNDYDGAIDCADADCANGGLETNCTNGVDDASDCDALSDCADADCEGWPACNLEVCNNGVDDADADSLADCADPACVGLDGAPWPGFQPCQAVETACNDAFDNDHDGVADCADADCAAYGMETACASGADDASDCDLLSDCDDPDCASHPACVVEICDNGIDDWDADALADCADPECAGQDGSAAAGLQVCEPIETTCNDVFDNDRNGAADCADAGCWWFGFETTCANGADDATDCDALSDCADPDCASHPSCVAEICNNGIDDGDADALVDCADLECTGQDGSAAAGAQVCEPFEMTCNDAFDNDRNGAADCADFRCSWFGFETSCADGADDATDCDVFSDCADPDCAAHPSCIAESCSNGVDDGDVDALVDCADPECVGQDGSGAAGMQACEPVETACNDAFDNDRDGAADCADADCASLGRETACTNGIDDASDCDALADCADPDCVADPGCAPEICDNGHDDGDADALADCADPECLGQLGQDAETCEQPESTCDDNGDNDADTFTDCADPDCSAACTRTVMFRLDSAVVGRGHGTDASYPTNMSVTSHVDQVPGCTCLLTDSPSSHDFDYWCLCSSDHAFPADMVSVSFTAPFGPAPSITGFPMTSCYSVDPLTSAHVPGTCSARFP